MEISEASLEAIRAHGHEAYPEECCGALLGAYRGQDVGVNRIERLQNAREDERRRRYLVAPEEYTRVEALADRSGLSVVGFYHSHPDHPAVPSEFDRDHALPFFHYVVLAVTSGVPGKAAAWILSEDRRVFEQETIVTRESGRT